MLDRFALSLEGDAAPSSARQVIVSDILINILATRLDRTT